MRWVADALVALPISVPFERFSLDQLNGFYFPWIQIANQNPHHIRWADSINNNKNWNHFVTYRRNFVSGLYIYMYKGNLSETYQRDHGSYALQFASIATIHLCSTSITLRYFIPPESFAVSFLSSICFRVLNFLRFFSFNLKHSYISFHWLLILVQLELNMKNFRSIGQWTATTMMDYGMVDGWWWHGVKAYLRINWLWFRRIEEPVKETFSETSFRIGNSINHFKNKK